MKNIQHSLNQLSVKLDRLTEEEIQRIIENIEGVTRKTIEFNFTLNLGQDKQWNCIENFSKIPVTTSKDNIVQIRLSESNFERPILSNHKSKNTCEVITSQTQLNIKRKGIDEKKINETSRQSERLANTRTESVTSKKFVKIQCLSAQEIEPSKNLESPNQCYESEIKPSNGSNFRKDISKLCVNTQKRNVWSDCKKTVDRSKLVEGAVVFAKQAGYSPWPARIVSLTKSRSSAIVEYLGYEHFTGSVKFNELVQLDDKSKDAIGYLIHFTLNVKRIRDFEQFQKAIIELKAVMGENERCSS